MTVEEYAFRDKLVAVVGKCSLALVNQIRGFGARDILYIGDRDPKFSDCHFAAWKSSSRVGANNCTTAVLFGRSAFALRSRRFFENFATICIPFGLGWLTAAPGLLRYVRRGLKFAGWLSLSGSAVPMPVFRNMLADQRRRVRIYGPDRWSQKEILKNIADLDGVLLRWVNEVEDGSHCGDLDILASSAAADMIEVRLAAEAGTAPIDLYSEDGGGGRTFKSVSYFPPTMSRKVLAAASVRPSGIKSTSIEWQFVCFCYHLLFHKSEQLVPKTEMLASESFAKPRYMRELVRLAEAAGEVIPRTVSDLEAVLRARDVFPEIDTIGFLSEHNSFLKDRYGNLRKETVPGLAVFLVRDFELGADLVKVVRGEIGSSGFEILEELAIDPMRDGVAIEKIRGGNWLDKAAKRGVAPPIHAFICRDPQPLRPSASARRRYPRLDNERMLLKTRIRTSVGGMKGVRRLNVIHASDNSAEAQSYIAVLRSLQTSQGREEFAARAIDDAGAPAPFSEKGNLTSLSSALQPVPPAGRG